MFSNLLGNAIKFTPEGGMVTLCARPLDGALSVTIADTGRGIAPEDLAHIFDRYWRPKGSEGEGAGLGLYIANGGRYSLMRACRFYLAPSFADSSV